MENGEWTRILQRIFQEYGDSAGVEFCAFAQDDPETTSEPPVTEEATAPTTAAPETDTTDATEATVLDTTANDVGQNTDSTVMDPTDNDIGDHTDTPVTESDTTDTPNTHSTVMELTTTEKISDPKHRFMSNDEKPAIFGSHAYNPITQEFEKVFRINETVAHNSSADAVASTKGVGRIGRYRVKAHKKELSDVKDSTSNSNSASLGSHHPMQFAIAPLSNRMPGLPVKYDDYGDDEYMMA